MNWFHPCEGALRLQNGVNKDYYSIVVVVHAHVKEVLLHSLRTRLCKTFVSSNWNCEGVANTIGRNCDGVANTIRRKYKR